MASVRCWMALKDFKWPEKVLDGLVKVLDGFGKLSDGLGKV